MPAGDPEFLYVSGQGRAGFPAQLASFEALSAQAVASGTCALDIVYGTGDRQTFDFFPARGQPRATLLFFHPGYWQSRDKSGFRFVAPAFTRRGLNVALVDYPLCPQVSLAELLESARTAVPVIREYARATTGQAAPIVAAGHSAGAHIAVELALTRPPLGVAGVIALSGIYELAPLVQTTLNAKLRLDPSSARAHSPLYRAAPDAPAALFAVGGDETTAFVDQSRRINEAWVVAGGHAALEIVPGADHFSLLPHFTAPTGTLAERIDELLRHALREPS